MKVHSVLVNKLSGSLNKWKEKGGKTFRTYKDKGITMSKLGKPTDPRTPAQLAHRAKWAQACVEWHYFTDEEKEKWEKIGCKDHISGFNAYIRWYFLYRVRRLEILADTYVDQTHQSSNYGSSETLRMMGHRYMRKDDYLYFDFPDLMEAETIESATLNLYCYYATSQDYFNYHLRPYMVREDWNEHTITYNTQPPTIGWYLHTRFQRDTTGWYEIDITALCNDIRNYPEYYHGIKLIDAPAGVWQRSDIRFRSREYPDSLYHPHIILETKM